MLHLKNLIKRPCFTQKCLIPFSYIPIQMVLPILYYIHCMIATIYESKRTLYKIVAIPSLKERTALIKIFFSQESPQTKCILQKQNAWLELIIFPGEWMF